ncbi:glycosyltransferase family 2 protein [Marinobacterium sedimentorum]|uniref:glycosyltransferase family 2 protein n=1 Tax=Marinobacterium sedimentorum TaxID=2927804 RepID=UPI0020C69ED0|nr:glycosyltransferase family 2 protein [Marinobacterium sedimentorum]MCP8688670.1 glycosyltransferase family 2 protein [Marinobacterium sedimentorum]
MKKLVGKTSMLVRKLRRESQVIGYVEKIKHDSIEGWAHQREGKSLELHVLLGKRSFPLMPKWLDRADVVQHHGSEFSNAGFYCTLPLHVQGFMKSSDKDIRDFKVLANNVELSIAGDFPDPICRLVQEPFLNGVKKGSEARDGVNSHILIENTVSSWGHFLIRGECFGHLEDISLLVNGRQLSCNVFPVENQSSTRTFSMQSYQIELPGYLWEYIGSEDSVELNILSGSELLLLEPLILNSSKTIDWLVEIAQMEAGQDKQYLSLLALEHLRFSKLLNRLPERKQHYYRDFAGKMNLDQYMSASEDQDENLVALGTFEAIDPTTLVLWKAQRDLNARLVGNGITVFEHVQRTMLELRLTGAVKEQFIKSVIPLLCRHGQLWPLRQEVRFSEFHKLAQSSNIWEKSLALGPLVADGLIVQASDAMWRIAKHLDEGWLNTECVHFAVVHTQQLEIQGDVEHSDAERLRYAYIGLLDGFKGDWFSRLHDLMLIDAMVALLSDLSGMTDYHKRDLVKAAVRHYGMSPVFWEKVSASKLQIGDSLFIRASRYWLSYHDALNVEHSHLNEYLPEIQAALLFFMQQGNPEAVMALREVIANVLPGLGDTDSEVAQVLIAQLLDSDPIEAVRLAASPVIAHKDLDGIISDYRTSMFDSLRLKTGRTHSVLYEAQVQAANSIKRLLLQIEQSEQAPVVKILHELQDRVGAMNNWNGMFLTADLLATGYRIAGESFGDRADLLMRLDDSLHKALAEAKQDFYLPAPICAAIATIQALPETALTRGWKVRTKQTLGAKFGTALHAPLFNLPVEQKVILGQGWPLDTLVVIYSCRKYLDSRIEAIRNTWIKDLQARGIPYLILVGDGNDRVEGDVLALDVSDTYEDLPKKSLKLFDWVYRNTRAQYVLKIDDDCYLDVDRYFDTLSYRKHHYYGRTLHRGVGAMDRAWHHSKSQTDRARKSIDKSPEPSVYADGGGAYCLSRIAMAALTGNSKLPAGRKLIASSFMEDKLVGDLLSLSHIMPSNEDYECYQRRRTFGEAVPVGMWENTFFPSKAAPTKVVHLDTDKDHDMVEGYRKSTELWPKKAWPSCWSPSVLLNSNQLELLTNVDKVKLLLAQPMFVIAVVRNEMIMLPHFLKHYRALGIETFIIADNCSDDGSREYLLEQQDVVLYSSDTEYKHSHYGVAWQQAILANHCINKWVLIADADELLTYPEMNKKTLVKFVKEVEIEGADCIRTDMIDMYPFGDLCEADFTRDDPFEVANWHDKEPLKEWALGSGWYSNSKNWASSLRHRIDTNSEPNAFVSQKYALVKYKPWMRFSQGIHYAAAVKVADMPVQFCHFKYHAAFKEKIIEEIKRKQHYDGAKEYRRYFSMLHEMKGFFADSDCSVKIKI